jgi:oligoendopeptidase F
MLRVSTERVQHYDALLHKIRDKRAVPPSSYQKHVETMAALLSAEQKGLGLLLGKLGYNSPFEEHCLSNEVSVPNMTSMLEAVKKSVPSVAASLHEELAQPLPVSSVLIKWDSACQKVVSAFERFSPSLGAVAKTIIEEKRIGWITSGNGKSLPAAKNFKPVLFIPYQGDISDVCCLSHEMMHGIHSILSSNHPFLVSIANPLILETVALFGERLFFEHERAACTEKEKRPLERLQKQRIMNSVFRCAAIHAFEMKSQALSMRGKGMAKNFSRVWSGCMKTYTLQNIPKDDPERFGWVTQRQLITKSFHTHPYVFAALVAAYLWEDYLKRGAAFIHDFDKLLKAGGTKSPKELLAPFGIQKINKAFWEDCLDLLARPSDSRSAAIRPSPRTAAKTTISWPRAGS